MVHVREDRGGEKPSPRGTARGAAVRLLARKDQSSGELREKLLRKGFEEAAVEEALRALSASGYLDDARWVEAFVRRSLEAGRGWTWIRVRLATLRAPVPPPVSSADEIRSLRALLERRRVDLATLTDPRDRSRITRFLRGRGYRSATIALALGRSAFDLDDEEANGVSE
jgi:regulatory protein